MTTKLYKGKQGAKVQSWNRNSQRIKLQTLIKRMGKNRRDDIFEEMVKIVSRDPAKIRAVMEYWFANTWNRIVSEDADVQAEKDARAEKVREATAVAIEAIRKAAVQMVLMDLKLPSGTKLRHATFAEALLAGGFFTKVGRKGEPADTIGEKLVEADLQLIWKTQMEK